MRVLHNREPTSPSQLADDMGMTRGAISKLADRLLTKALITREASPDDGRSQTLRLTTQGTVLMPELAALADENEAECFTHLSNRDRSTMQRILKETVTRLGLTAVPAD